MGVMNRLKFNTEIEANNALSWVNSQMGFPTKFEDKQNTLTWDNVTFENGFYYFFEPSIQHNYTTEVYILPTQANPF